MSQHLSEFDLHARAILGLPIPAIEPAAAAAASAVILADRHAEDFRFEGLAEALGLDARVDVRLFGKPVTRPNRRMGVALARGETVEVARALALAAAGRVRIVYCPPSDSSSASLGASAAASASSSAGFASIG